MKDLFEHIVGVSDKIVEAFKDMAINGPSAKQTGKFGLGHTDDPESKVFEEEETIGSTDPDKEDPGQPGLYDKKIYKLPFDVSKIYTAYVGKPHKCMCGCSGTYYYSTMGYNELKKQKSYEVEGEKPNDAKVARIYNKMKANATRGVEVIGDYIYTVIVGQTQYTVYLHN
jgi:hypothetical protein